MGVCMCHGIPDSRQLQDGDIVNVNVTVFLDKYHGDTLRALCIGPNVSPKAHKLVADTEEALKRSIDTCKRGVPVRHIGGVCVFNVWVMEASNRAHYYFTQLSLFISVVSHHVQKLLLFLHEVFSSSLSVSLLINKYVSSQCDSRSQ